MKFEDGIMQQIEKYKELIKNSPNEYHRLYCKKYIERLEAEIGKQGAIHAEEWLEEQKKK